MLAIVAAVKEEVGVYLRERGFQPENEEEGIQFFRSPQAEDEVVVVSGVGKDRAQEATRAVAKACKPELIVSAGFAAAATPDLKTGALVLCDNLMAFDAAPPYWSADTVISEATVDVDVLDEVVRGMQGSGEQVSLGGCLSVDHFVSGGPLKTWVGRNLPVSVIDMESYWVCQAASELGLSRLVARSVLDTVEQSVPVFAGREAANPRRGRWARAVGYAVRRPGDIPGLLNLAGQVKVASASLARLLAGVSFNARLWMEAG